MKFLQDKYCDIRLSAGWKKSDIYYIFVIGDEIGSCIFLFPEKQSLKYDAFQHTLSSRLNEIWQVRPERQLSLFFCRKS